MQKVSRQQVCHAAILAMVTVFALLCDAAMIDRAAAQRAMQPPNTDVEDKELDTDPAKALKAGFKVLELDRGDDGSLPARVIEKELLPDLAKDLPWPAPGFRYALTDLDGDGAPELFLVIKHYTLCEAGCPIRIYKFRDGAWKLLLARTTIMTAIRPPVAKGDKPRVALMTNGPDLQGPTQTDFYALEGDKFVAVAAGKKRK